MRGQLFTRVLRATRIFLLAGLFQTPAAVAQEEVEHFPCDGVLELAGELAGILHQVPKYGSTYVLAVSDRHAQSVPSADAPAVRQLTLAVYAGSEAEAVAKALQPAAVEVYPFAPGKIIEDVLAGEIDGGVLWAPLAGLAVLELDFDYQISLHTAGTPSPAPGALAAGALAAGTLGSGTSARAACATEIGGQLEGYGVVPAEKLVRLDIRDFLHLLPPARDAAEATAGSALFAQHCARCHGPDAVASPDSLAPVSLLISTARFSYPGFLYIVMNGRSQNGMPGFNGSLDPPRVQRIYQYLRERSHGTIGPAAGASGATD